VSTSWESIIDSWGPWPSLMEHWEGPNGNRHRILGFLNARYPAEHFASTEVFEQLINNAADLRASLFYTQPPKPASLANFSDVPVKQKQQTAVIIDLVTTPPAPEQKKKTNPYEGSEGWEERKQRLAREKSEKDAELERRDQRRREIENLTAQIKSIRPW